MNFPTNCFHGIFCQRQIFRFFHTMLSSHNTHVMELISLISFSCIFNLKHYKIVKWTLNFKEIFATFVTYLSHFSKFKQDTSVDLFYVSFIALKRYKIALKFANFLSFCNLHHEDYVRTYRIPCFCLWWHTKRQN